MEDWENFKKTISLDLRVEKNKFKREKTIQQDRQEKKEGIIIKPRPRIQNYLTIPKEESLNRNCLKKLKKGLYPVDLILDLHGYSLDQAYHLFVKKFFLALSLNFRLLLIITGKGRLDTITIRSSFMKWVEEPSIAHHVLYCNYAPMRDGGEGAFYLYLRNTLSTRTNS